MSTDYEDWAHDEVSLWPGASISFEKRAKHNAAVVAFGETTRFVVYPDTPSDGKRGVLNFLTNVRAELRTLGLERIAVPKATGPKRERNPGAAERELPMGEPAPVIADPWEALQELANQPLITAAGAYPDIASEDYHRHPNLLPSPSISSSGLKTLLTRSPAHYWHDSPLNPYRPPEKDKAHFRVGKAAHDVVLLGARWATHYHVTPEGFSRAKTKAMADEIAAVEAAEAAGLTVLSYEQAQQVQAMAASLNANKLAKAVLSNGEPEVTLAWQDAETGVWLRARPDFLPHKRQIIPDLKTAADGSPKGFQRAIASCGYSQSAALYLDGIEAIYGERPTNWLHVVIEKEAPYVVSLFELPAEDIGRGKWLNRKAIRLYAECLNSGKWPGYADEPVMLGLPGWDRKQIDEGHTPEEAAWGFSQAA